MKNIPQNPNVPIYNDASEGVFRNELHPEGPSTLPEYDKTNDGRLRPSLLNEYNKQKLNVWEEDNK